MLQVFLISKALIKFKAILKQHIENLMDVFESKGRNRILNFL